MSLRCIACALLVFIGSPALAQRSSDALSDQDLARMRAGYLNADGLEFDFAALVRTRIDGTDVLETRFAWTPEGVVRATDGSAASSADAAGNLQLRNATGDTLVGSGVAGGNLQTFILNSASGRDVSQTLEATLTLPGFGALQDHMDASRLLSNLGGDVAHALTALH